MRQPYCRNHQKNGYTTCHMSGISLSGWLYDLELEENLIWSSLLMTSDDQLMNWIVACKALNLNTRGRSNSIYWRMSLLNIKLLCNCDPWLLFSPGYYYSVLGDLGQNKWLCSTTRLIVDRRWTYTCSIPLSNVTELGRSLSTIVQGIQVLSLDFYFVMLWLYLGTD